MDPLLTRIQELLKAPGLVPEAKRLLEMAAQAHQTGQMPPMPEPDPMRATS